MSLPARARASLAALIRRTGRIGRVGRVGGAFVAGGLIAFAACNACGRKGDAADPNVASGENGQSGEGASGAIHASRTSVAADASVTAVRDVAMWTSARSGQTEDLATLATHEGAAGLIEAAADPELHVTALRAMAYARGWAQLPYLASAAGGRDDDEARIALLSAVELGARPRRSEDVEDETELREGCEKLGALARDVERARDRRVLALRALRMLPCPKQDLPTDLDAK
jgi:hypothetical protein